MKTASQNPARPPRDLSLAIALFNLQIQQKLAKTQVNNAHCLKTHIFVGPQPIRFGKSAIWKVSQQIFEKLLH